ncbi:MAG TPA: phosphoglucosamine mutase, partial [Actinomycetota bacterium]|nr:phosphoglucosamine mutase [Actinomycetota bacterium]
MPRLFGTDGVRGIANLELTPEIALRLGRAAATAFRSRHARPAVLIVRDTRRSGDLLEAALSAGLLSAGADVLLCGVLPTPAAAFLTPDAGADAGAVVSASHNPASHNGIKFFGRDGFKLNDAEEQGIESLLDVRGATAIGADVGMVSLLPHAEDRYVAHALRSLEGRRLDGMKVVIDCAHGAAFRTSPRALEEAGAEVIAINVEPDGMNINVGCGSTSPEAVAEAVIRLRADVGLAHDGDADRVLAVDARGDLVDGDAIIAILAAELKEQDRLAGNMVVTTVMANLGFRLAMAAAGIDIVETAVGDRYVIEAMRRHGAEIGGEQSGHVILADCSTTGDGLITGLRLLGRMASTGRTLADLAKIVERYPQVLVNVPVRDREALTQAGGVWEAVEQVRRELGDLGRVLVRPSGTEAVVRVM